MADRKAHAALERAQREAKTQERNAILTRMVQGAKVTSSSSLQQQQQVPNADDEDEDDDDEFFAAFRAKRLQGIYLIMHWFFVRYLKCADCRD